MPKETNKIRNGSPATIKKSLSNGGFSGVSVPAAPPLDTSEQVPPDTSQVLGRKNLEKRARAKYISDIISFPLANLRSVLSKQYKASQTCSGELAETPGKVTGKYCGCRWCLVCSRIRTARLITGYMPAIEAMPEQWFLTLSRPNVRAGALKSEIQAYLKCASLITRHLREKTHFKKNKYNSQPKFSSLRKIECTYNEVDNTYHPHFHFIFDNGEAAQIFLNEWLRRNKTAKAGKGNLLKKADAGSAMELFKYFTKVVSKSSSGKPGDYRIHVAALDVMFVAMRAVRTFQPCGVIKAVSEEVEAEIAEASGREEVNFWQWVGNDWINTETAELLSGWSPSQSIQDIAKHLVLPVDPAAPVEFAPLANSVEFDQAPPAEQLPAYSPVRFVPVPKKEAAKPLPPLAFQSTMFPELAGTSLLTGSQTWPPAAASSPPI